MTRAAPSGRVAAASLTGLHGGLLVLWWVGLISTSALIAGGLGAAVIIAALARGASGTPALVLGATLTLGPFAGPMLLLLHLPGTASTVVPASDQTSAPLTPADRVMAQITAGRRYTARTDPPAPFLDIFQSGSLHDQQAALSALARNYGPELRPALDRAVASDIPAIRVQASAAYAVLRDRYANRLRALSAVTITDPAAFEAERKALRSSGFVDAATLDALATPQAPRDPASHAPSPAQRHPRQDTAPRSA